MSFFFVALALMLAIVAGGVLTSNIIAWYEAVNRQPALLESRISGEGLRFAGGMLATETLLLFLTLLLRPLGWGERRTESRDRNRPAAGMKTPIILLHGLFHNRACWWWIRRRLHGRGAPVFTLNLPLWRRNIPSATARVARKVEELRISRGVEKVHLAGHSMGGLVALHYLQNGGADTVDRCVLLGAPVLGSKMAALAISPMGRALLPGSALLKDLFRSKLPAQVRITAIYSRHDNLVLPPENARLEGVRNHELVGVQHTSLLYHPRAVDVLVSALMENP